MVEIKPIGIQTLSTLGWRKSKGFMEFFFFIMVTATLFVRPAELVESLSVVPFYNITLSLCLVVAFIPLCNMLTSQRLTKDPVTFSVSIVMIMIFVSNMMNMDLYYARMNAFEFIKTLLYYLLLIVTVTTPSRVRSLLTWLVVFTAILTTVSLLHYNGTIVVASLPTISRLTSDADDAATMVQLNATGIYGDPNDFCSLLSVVIMICIYRLMDNRAGFTRVTWLIPLGLFFYALVLTRSRGGFLAMLAGFMAQLVSRFGWSRAILLGGITVPPLILIVGGRSTEFSSSTGGEDTFESRLGFWREGFMLLVRHPLFGIGSGKFQDYVGFVAHNSFVHASTELGLLGGAFFMGVFLFPLWFLQRLRPPLVNIADYDMNRLRPYLIAILVSTMVSMMSISRCYNVPTYMIPAIVVAYLRIVARQYPDALPELGGRLLIKLASVYLGVLTFTYIVVRVKLG